MILWPCLTILKLQVSFPSQVSRFARPSHSFFCWTNANGDPIKYNVTMVGETGSVPSLPSNRPLFIVDSSVFPSPPPLSGPRSAPTKHTNLYASAAFLPFLWPFAHLFKRACLHVVCIMRIALFASPRASSSLGAGFEFAASQWRDHELFPARIARFFERFSSLDNHLDS